MAAAVYPFGTGLRAVVLGVGDSPALRYDRDGWRNCLTGEALGGWDDDMYSTATDALPDNVGTVAVAVHTFNPGDLLVLCSDGLANPMRGAEIRDRLAAWWGDGRVPALTEFYWQVSFRAKTFGDDRTAICVWAR